jgi:hypothetical protein
MHQPRHARFECARLAQWRARNAWCARRADRALLLGLPLPPPVVAGPNWYTISSGGGGTGYTTITYLTPMNSSQTNDIWYNVWGSTSTASAITTSDTWQTWTTTTTSTTAGPWFQSAADSRTPEQIAHDRERLRLAQEKQLAAAREADDKARALLESVLDGEELVAFRRDGHLIVNGRSGRRYRLRQGRTANIDVIGRDGRVLHRLCAHPDRTMPHLDIMLAQKLWLETDEAEFIRRANTHHTLAPGEPVLAALP